MATPRSSRTHVQAYRYGLRRMENALATGESLKPVGGHRPALWAMIGGVFAGIGLAGAAVYGLVKPAPSIGDAQVVVDADSGGAFVIRDDVAYPTMNFASARLAAAGEGATAAKVAQVNAETLSSYPKGNLIGIPGAPNQIPESGDLLPDRWIACDTLDRVPGGPPDMEPDVRTTVLVGVQRSWGSAATDRAALVTADDRYYLVFGGQKLLVGSPDESQMMNAMGLDVDAAREVSPGLLNAIPEPAAVEMPRLRDAGDPVSYGEISAEVGDVLRVEDATQTRYYVALSDGLLQVSSLQADLVRATAGSGASIAEIAPSAVTSAPASSADIGLSGLPSTMPELTGAEEGPALCMSWENRNGTITRSTAVLDRVPLPAGGRANESPVTAEVESGEQADEVYVEPGRGLVLGRSVDGETTNQGSLFLITDTGLSYPLSGTQALSALGLQGSAEPGAPELISLLPPGPELDPEAARRYFGQEGSAP